MDDPTKRPVRWVALAVIAPVVALLVLAVLRVETPESIAEDREWDAKSVAEKFARERLKAPSTASFSAEQGIDVTADGLYIVTGYVDAQNSFGAQLRSRYACTVTPVGGDQWQTRGFCGVFQ